MNKLKSAILVGAVMALPACATTVSGGEKISELSMGMNKANVEAILGKPSHVNPSVRKSGKDYECRAYPYKKTEVVGITPIRQTRYYKVFYENDIIASYENESFVGC